MNRWRLSLYLLIAAVVICAFFYDSTWFSHPPQLNSADIASANLEIWDNLNDGAIVVSKTTTDTSTIAELTRQIGAGNAVRKHRCSHIGMLTFTVKNGQSTKIQILPGHEEKFYEFRIDGEMFQLNRAGFLATLSKLGVTADNLAGPKP